MKTRTLLAAVLAALLVPAVATAAPAKPASKAAPKSATAAQPLQGLSVGGFVGYETDDVSGLSLRLDGELPFRALSPQVNLSWVGSIGYSRLTDDLGGGVDFVSNVLKIIPAARFSFPLNPQLTLFGDAGLGIAYVSAEVDFPAPFDALDIDDSTLNLIMRIGGGAWYQVNEQTRIGAMLEFDPYFGDYGFSGADSQTTFLIQVGAMFRL